MPYEPKRGFYTFRIGDRVEGGADCNNAAGQVVAIVDPPIGDCDVEVAWDNGTRTLAVSADLRPA